MPTFDKRVFDSVTFDAAYTGGGTIAANAVFFKAQSGSFPADAVIAPYAYLYQLPVEVVYSPAVPEAQLYQIAVEVVRSTRVVRSLSADADVVTYGTFSGSFAADACISATVGSTFTADSIARTSSTGSVSADAIRLVPVGGSITGLAIVLRAMAQSFAEDAIVKASVGSLVAADALITAGHVVSQFSADAYIGLTWGPWTPPESNGITFSVQADAFIVSTQYRSFTSDADIASVLISQTGSFTADALVMWWWLRAIAVRATIHAPIASSISADAYAVISGAGSVAADSIVHQPVSGSISAQAAITRLSTFTFASDATIIWSRVYGSVTADAIRKKTISVSSLTASAAVWKSVAKTFTGNAAFKSQSTGLSFSADATFVRGGLVLANAITLRAIQSQLSANASFTAKDVRSFTADAHIPMYFTLNAVVAGVSLGSFTAKARFFGGTVGTIVSAFSADARIIVAIKSISANARILRRVQSSVTANAVIVRYTRRSSSFTARAYFVQRKQLTVSAIKKYTWGTYRENVLRDKPRAFFTQFTGYDDYSLGLAPVTPTPDWGGDQTRTYIGWNTYQVNGTADVTFEHRRGEPDSVSPVNAPYQSPRTAVLVGLSGGGWHRIWNLETIYGVWTLEFIAQWNGYGPDGFFTTNPGVDGDNYRTALAVIDADTWRMRFTNLTSSYFVENVQFNPTISEDGTLSTGLGWKANGGSTNKPAHIVIRVRTANENYREWSVYVNGIRVWTQWCGGYPLLHKNVNGVGALNFGEDTEADAGFGSGNLSGSLTAIALYDYALSEAVIARHAGLYPKGFTANAIIRRGGSLTARAIIRDTGIPGQITSRSIIKKTVATSFSASARIVGFGSLTLDAVIDNTILKSFGAHAWIYSPRTEPPLPNQTPLVAITVDGVDITHDVMLSTASFTMAVNGAPGNFQMQVRDSGQNWNFVSGSEITVDIDGRRKFGGYVTLVNRGYAFPVDDTSDPASVERFWTLSGVDYNILFSARVIYKKSDPANVALREWPAGTQDDEIIRYIFDNYTDLAADNANTDGVQHVGHPNPDRRGVVGSGGLTFGDAMREVNRLIGAVWYFDQHKTLHFVDVDQMDSFVGLSDNPGVGQVGYRELEHNTSGASLANDALVWGTGKGSEELTFSRSTDATSVGVHGRWQYGEFTSTLYKQASVDLRASTVVNGTPQSLRGAKNDKRSWTVTTYESSFAVGQRVSIESEVFGLSEIVPIRKMTITFPTKKTPQFLLVLTHEIDEPWNLYEFYFPKFSFNHRAPKIDTNIDQPCQSTSGGPGGCVGCEMTDTFERTVAPSNGAWGGNAWGVSDAGITWNTYADDESSSYTYEVGGGVAKISVVGSNLGYAFADLGGLSIGTSFSMRIKFKITATPTPTDFTSGFKLGFAFSRGSDALTFRLTQNDVSNPSHSYLTIFRGPSDPHPDSVSFDYVDGTWYSLLFAFDSETKELHAKVWEYGTTEPGWMLADDLSAYATDSVTIMSLWVEGDQSAYTNATVEFDDLAIDGVNRCDEYRFDNFNRSVSGGWGTSDYGASWITFVPSGTSCDVDGSSGHLVATSTDIYANLQDNWPISEDGSFNCITRLKLIYSGAYSRFRWPVGTYNGNYWNFEIEGGNLTLETGGVSDVIVSLPVLDGDTGWINIRREALFNQYQRVKIWSDGSSEPSDWSVVQDTVGQSSFDVGASSSYFQLLLDRGNSGGLELWVDYIDFDYDGKPCYQDCSGDTGWADFVWRWATGNGAGLEYSGRWAVANDEAYLDVAAGGGSGSGIGRDNVGVQLLYDDAPDFFDYLQQSGSLTISGIMTIPFDLAQGSGLPQASVSIHVVFHDVGETYSIYLAGMIGGALGGRVQLHGRAYDDDDNVYPGAIGAGDYPFTLSITPTGATATLSGNSLSIGGTYNFTAIDTIQINMGDGFNASDLGGVFKVSALKFGTFGCADVFPSPATSSIDCGGMNSSVASAGQKVFQLPYTYIPNSSRVWVDGLFKRPGYEYTEQPSAGKITFDAALSGGESVHIEYVADEAI